MKTLVTKIVLATSVALGTLVAAGAAYCPAPKVSRSSRSLRHAGESQIRIRAACHRAAR